MRLFNVTSRALIDGVLPLSKDVVGVFFSPSRSPSQMGFLVLC